MSEFVCRAFWFAFFAAAVSFPVAADEVLTRGSFTGASGHDTRGEVSVVKTAGGEKLVLGSDFSFDGAPDPKVGFGAGGTYDPESQLSHLRRNAGEQTYDIPNTLDLSGYDEVYIWCQRYSVPLGVARLR